MKTTTQKIKKSIAIISFLFASCTTLIAQNPAYRINSTVGGFVAPTMTQLQRTTMSNVAGCLVYQTDGVAGYYYNDGTSWKMINNAGALVGQVPVANGGTGVGSLTSNGVLYGNGTGAVNVTGASTAANQVLATATAGGAPSFQTLGGGVMIVNCNVLPALSAGAYTGGFTTFNYTGPATFYYAPGCFLTVTESQAQIKMPKCVITRIRVLTAFGAQTTAAATPVTVRKNGIATSLFVNVAAAAPASTYYEASSTGVAFADGDLMSISATWASGGFGLNRIEITYYLLP